MSRKQADRVRESWGKMRKLVLVGVGGFGREVAWLVERINQQEPTWELLGFVDDNPQLQGKVIGGYPVLGDCAWLQAQDESIFACCTIGSARVRALVIEKLPGRKFATLVDPSVLMSDRVQIGEGCIACAGTILTVDISLGRHVIVNWDCTIGHDAVLEDFVTLYPSVNISGNTVLGRGVEMGTGSQIIQGLTVSAGAIVGAGAVVVKDIKEAGTYVGAPARKLQR